MRDLILLVLFALGIAVVSMGLTMAVGLLLYLFESMWSVLFVLWGFWVLVLGAVSSFHDQ